MVYARETQGDVRGQRTTSTLEVLSASCNLPVENWVFLADCLLTVIIQLPTNKFASVLSQLGWGKL
jgi:hypothetical protein